MEIISIALTIFAVLCLQVAGEVAAGRRYKRREARFAEAIGAIRTNVGTLETLAFRVEDSEYFELFQRTFPNVYGCIAPIVGDLAVADELAVETFLEVFRRGSLMPEGEPQFLAYALNSAERKAREFVAARDHSKDSVQIVEQQLRAKILDWRSRSSRDPQHPSGKAIGQP
jgi:hypothetical protein